MGVRAGDPHNNNADDDDDDDTNNNNNNINNNNHDRFTDTGAALLCHILLNNPSNKTFGLNFAPEYRWHSMQTIKHLLTVTDPATQEKMAKEKDIAGE